MFTDPHNVTGISGSSDSHEKLYSNLQQMYSLKFSVLKKVNYILFLAFSAKCGLSAVFSVISIKL